MLRISVLGCLRPLFLQDVANLSGEQVVTIIQELGIILSSKSAT